MSEHLDAYAGAVAEQGYAHHSIRQQIVVIADFSRWLKQKQIAVRALDSKVLDRFLRLRCRQHRVRRGDPRALERLLAWKLALHGAPAEGRVVVRVNPAGARYSRFPANAPVALPRVAGHRDADSTECPGNALYGELWTQNWNWVLTKKVGGFRPALPGLWDFRTMFVNG